MSTSVFDQPYALLDSTGVRIAQAVEALSPSNVAVDISTSLSASGWTNSSPYTQTWLNNKVSDECGIKVEFLAGAVNNDVLYLEYEKVPGGVKFTAPKKPSTDIPVVVHIINAKAESITSISGDMVSTDVVSGAGNVDEALGIHNQAIANKLDTANVYNGLDKSASGYALDARQGKALNDKFSKCVFHGDWSSNSSLTVPFGSQNGNVIMVGYLQGVGSVVLDITIANGSIGGVYNIISGDSWSSGYHTISFSSNNLVISSSAVGKSSATFIVGAWNV